MNLPSHLARTPRRLDVVRETVHSRDLVALPCYEIDVDGRTLRFSAPERDKMSYARVATIFGKEPTTIPYLETFSKDDVFLDIGANVGMYTVYAAVMTGCRVFSVEPEALNYAELNKNIYLNNLHGQVTAFCAAASNERKIGELLLGAFAAGYSHHDFGENTWTKDMQWTSEVRVNRDERITQGCISVTIDNLVESGVVPIPTHVKIDVDGLEPKVVEGAMKTFRDPRVKTVLIEVDFRSEATQSIVKTMTEDGWSYSMDQLITNRAIVMKPERVRELMEIKKDGFNFIFYRDQAYGELFRQFLAKYDPPYKVGGGMKTMPNLITREPPPPPSSWPAKAWSRIRK